MEKPISKVNKERAINYIFAAAGVVLASFLVVAAYEEADLKQPTIDQQSDPRYVACYNNNFARAVKDITDHNSLIVLPDIRFNYKPEDEAAKVTADKCYKEVFSNHP